MAVSKSVSTPFDSNYIQQVIESQQAPNNSSLTQVINVPIPGPQGEKGDPQPLFVSSDTMKVAQWIKGGFKPV
jgi:hypothetical protein